MHHKDLLDGQQTEFVPKHADAPRHAVLLPTERVFSTSEDADGE